MGRKKTGGGFRSVGFRMPPENYQVLADYAEMLGVDVSAVLNHLVSESVPHWREQVRQERSKRSADESVEQAYLRTMVDESIRRQVSALVDTAWGQDATMRDILMAQARKRKDGEAIAREAETLLKIRDIEAKARQEEGSHGEGEGGGAEEGQPEAKGKR